MTAPYRKLVARPISLPSACRARVFSRRTIAEQEPRAENHQRHSDRKRRRYRNVDGSYQNIAGKQQRIDGGHPNSFDLTSEDMHQIGGLLAAQE